MGGLMDFFRGGQNALAAQPGTVAPWATANQGQQDATAQMMAAKLEEEKRKRQAQGLLTLVGLATIAGKGNGVDSGQLTVDSGKPGSAAKAASTPGKASGPAAGVAMAARAGGGRRDVGAQASKVAGLPAGAVEGPIAASAKSSMLMSPVVGASISAGGELLGGLLGGGGEEELAKQQMKQQGQARVFDGIRSMTESIRARNQEFRSAWRP